VPERRSRAGDYREARIGAAVSLGFVLVLMVVLDFLSDTYSSDPVVAAALIGAIVALLGVRT
jgi:hypothetical protein